MTLQSPLPCSVPWQSVCVCACVRACESACVCACARLCVFVRACVVHLVSGRARPRACWCRPVRCWSALRSNVDEIQRDLLHGQVRLHADKCTVQNVAVSLAQQSRQLQKRPLAACSCSCIRYQWKVGANANPRVEIGTCRRPKSTPDKFRWTKCQEAGWRTVATEGPTASARSFTLSAAFWLEMVCVPRVLGLGQITWRIVLEKKMRVTCEKIAPKSRNSRRLCS